MDYRMMLELFNEEDDDISIALSLPASDYQIQDALDQIRAYENDGKCHISIVACSVLPELVRARIDSQNVFEVNYLAHRLKNISENPDEYAILKAVKHKVIPEDTEGEIIGMRDVINLTYGLEDVSVVSNIHSDADLGQFVIENEMEDYISELPESVLDKLDREVIGATFRKKDGGVISDGMYVMASEFELPDVYDDTQKPWEIASSDFVFKLVTTNAPWETTDDLEGRIFEINIPMSDEDIAKLTKAMGLSDITKAEYITMESTIPWINDFNFSNMKDFHKLNDVARLYAEMAPCDKAKFKAAVLIEGEYNSVAGAGRLLDIATHIDDYEFDNTVRTDRAYMLKYLSKHMDSRMDLEMFDDMDAYRPARNIMGELGCHISSYGLISKQGGTLYDIIPRHDAAMEDSEDEALREAMEMAEKENSEGVRAPMELSDFIVEVSAMVHGEDKTPVLDWIEYAAFMVDNQAEGEATLEKELSEIYTSLCYVKNNFDHETLQRTLKSVSCPNEIIFRGMLHYCRFSEETIADLANRGHLMDGYVPIKPDEEATLKFVYVDDDEGNMFMMYNPKMDALGYMKQAADIFKRNNSDYNACLKDDMLGGAVMRHISDPILRETIKANFLNGTAIDSIVVYHPHFNTVDEYLSEDFPDNIEDIIDYQGFDGNTINM